MATIHIRRAHRLSLAEARTTAEHIARRVAQRHSVTWRWDGDDAIELVAPPGMANGARGRVTLDDQEVAIEVTLPFALRPAKRFVETQLRSKLDAVLGVA
jgi:putative polyhydroxyalkanoate system protein